MVKSNKRLQSGFTLIELLIVIVIIGILAGVLIAVIDPASTQNRARDASVQATLNKIALAAGGFRSAYGVTPDGTQFPGVITGETDDDCNPTGSGTATQCFFTMDNLTLPLACGTGTSRHLGNGTQTSLCYFLYQTDAANADFDIYAKSFGVEDSIFRYDSTDSAIHICSGTTLTQNCVNPI